MYIISLNTHSSPELLYDETQRERERENSNLNLTLTPTLHYL